MDHQTRGDQGCPKCGNQDVEIGDIATTGTGLSRLFDVQLNQFQVVSCTNCGYSEFYRVKRSKGKDIVDFFFSR